jgi:hypothetical protein
MAFAFTKWNMQVNSGHEYLMLSFPKLILFYLAAIPYIRSDGEEYCPVLLKNDIN